VIKLVKSEIDKCEETH
jgi:adenylate kinase